MYPARPILIVDDYPANRLILQEILGATYPLVTATSGEEALTLAAETRPALILLDVMMPGIDGYETCKRLRALPMLRHTKILMVSARALVTERLKGYAAGADDYFTKPFDIEELRAKVRVYYRLKTVEEFDHLKDLALTFLAHTTRTPLNGLLALLHLLGTPDGLAPGECRRLVHLATQSLHTLCELCEQVTVLSAMQAGQWEAQWLQMDLCEVVLSALSTVAPELNEQQLALRTRFPETALMTLDPGQIQLLLTLVLQFVIHDSIPLGTLQLQIAPASEDVVLTVQYRSQGMTPELVSRAFDPFAETYYHSQGWGIRLALAQSIAQAHQGCLTVEHRPQVGTTWRLFLPADPIATVPVAA